MLLCVCRTLLNEPMTRVSLPFGDCDIELCLELFSSKIFRTLFVEIITEVVVEVPLIFFKICYEDACLRTGIQAFLSSRSRG